MQTENKNTEAILVLERQIYNYQRANAELQTSLGERSLMQKYGLYLLLVGWFLALEFMKNWMGFFVEITDVAYIPIVIVFAVLLVLEYRRDKRRRETMEQIKENRHRCNELRQQIETLRGRMCSVLKKCTCCGIVCWDMVRKGIGYRDDGEYRDYITGIAQMASGRVSSGGRPG